MPITEINSDVFVEDIYCHFKTSAGPGAGKTYWLVNHIKNVLHNSNNLFKTKKIACITYTNIAVETILNRLGTTSYQVEVSTIHSFFYKNIVKPYAHFIADDYCLNATELDGHEDIVLSFGKIKSWADQTNQQYLYFDNSRKEKVTAALENLQWILENDNVTLKINPQKPYLGRITKDISIRNNSLIEFKKIYWNKGQITHDDVLFFAYQIVKKFPFVAEIISSKFPFQYIDEFQDSNPIQVELFKIFATQGAKIGVIGDIAQSIYGFQGADPKLLDSFVLKDIKEYKLSQNRRSSDEIIDMLNSIRTDIQQTKFRRLSIAKPVILVGDMSMALRSAKQKCENENVVSLSRNNITSNAMKSALSILGLDTKSLQKLREVDSHPVRSKYIYNSIKAISYATEGKFQDAIRQLEKVLNFFKDNTQRKRLALEHLVFFLENYPEIEQGNLLEFTSLIRKHLISTFPYFKAGSIKAFYENNTFKQLSLCVSIPEDMSLHKTIHKAKGDEFDNVLLVLQEEKDLDIFIKPDIISNEEHRINYVALSRAKNRLFISIPTISPKSTKLLQEHFNIEQL